LNQATKPAKPTAAERNEKVRKVLLAASAPLDSIHIAEIIGEDWCMWNGIGRGSEITPALRQIGARSSKGKWSLEEPERAADIGPTGNLDLMPHHVMPLDSWKRIKEGLKQRA